MVHIAHQINRTNLKPAYFQVMDQNARQSAHVRITAAASQMDI